MRSQTCALESSESRTQPLPAAWRAPFESAFGCRLQHVAAVTGPAVDRCLAAVGAAALAVDANTILLSTPILHLPEPVRLRAIGHELAHTMQLARGGTDAPEFLEAEAWQAAEAALCGRRRPVLGGGTGPLAISAFAILLTEAANTYFKTTKKCSHWQGRAYLDIADADRLLLKPMIFEKVLDTMIAKKNHRYFVLFTHGTHDGFMMPLTQEHVDPRSEYGSVQPRAHVLITLLQIDEVLTDMKAAQDAATQADRGLAKWNALLVKIGHPEPAASPQDAANVVQQWLNQTVRPLKLTEKRVRELLAKRRQVLAKNIQFLEIRSCFMGAERRTLHVLRRFFGAEGAGAPTEFSAFGYLDVLSNGGSIGEAAFARFCLDHTEARQYTSMDGMTKGKVALAYKRKSDHEAETFAAATSKAAMNEWITLFLDGPAHPPLNHIPVHFLAVETATSRIAGVPGPMDWRYWTHIAYAGPLDTDDLPASLLRASPAKP
jgi:hypothetical protein